MDDLKVIDVNDLTEPEVEITLKPIAIEDLLSDKED